MPDPLPDFPYRLPPEVTARIRAAVRPARPARVDRRRRSVRVPATCIFGSGATFGDDRTAPDGDHPAP
jgi:hypothetical protein